MGIWWCCLTHSVVVKINESRSRRAHHTWLNCTQMCPQSADWGGGLSAVSCHSTPSTSCRISLNSFLFRVTLSPGLSARRHSRKEADKPLELLSIMRRWSLALRSLPPPSMACGNFCVWPAAGLGRRRMAEREPDTWSLEPWVRVAGGEGGVRHLSGEGSSSCALG